MRVILLAALAATVFVVSGCETKAKVDMDMKMKDLANGITSGLTGSIAALSSLVYGSAPAEPARAPGFTLAASMSLPRGLHTATLMGDKRVLVVGGVDATRSGPSYIGQAEVYDPFANAFTRVGSTSIERVFHAAVALSDGRVLVCGGFGREAGATAETDLASAYVFDPARGDFEAVGPLSAPRRGHRAVRLPSGQVLVVGGNVAVAELFDPASGTFSKAGSLPAAREWANVALVSGSVLVIGGQPGMDLYVPASRAFVAGASPSSVRGGATLDAVGADEAVLAGGRKSATEEILEVERFKDGQWYAAGTLSAPRAMHGSATSGPDLLLAGGVTQGAAPNTLKTLATADFLPATGSAQPFTMAHSRNGCTVTTLASGRFLVAGGFEGGTTDLRGLDGTSVAWAEVFTKP